MRVNALKEEQRNGTPPLVPRAYPPTTMAEVPPGTAQFRAAPARKSGDADLPDGAQKVLDDLEKTEAEGTKRFKEDAVKDAEKLEDAAAATQSNSV